MTLGLVLVPGTAAADQGDIAAYMRARAADADGEVRRAAADYATALAAAPDNAIVALPAYREALADGDQALAVKAAAVLRGTPAAPPDLPLVALAIAAQAGDAAAADAAIADLDKTVLRVLAPSLRAWTAFAQRRDFKPALAMASSAMDPVATRFALEQRGPLQIATGAVDEGVATVNAALAAGAPVDLRIEAASLLFAAKRDEAARALLIGTDPTLVALRDGMAAKATLGFGVSRLLARVAADLVSQNNGALTIALARTALIADPGNDRARLLLASALAGEGGVDRALATLDGVDAASPYAHGAAAGRVTILANAGRDDQALAAAKALATGKDAGPRDFQLYGDRLVAEGDQAEGARWYRRILDAGDDRDWATWLQYGAALDQAGDWQGARPALEKSVALAPREAVALNYLGYAGAEHGDDIAGSTRLIERASALKPDDPSITDSLGWAYYIGGSTARALPLIERAAQGEPANAEIGEHLGDIYWSVGRRYEARYAWRAAALTADAGDTARIVAKIAHGLPPGTAATPMIREIAPAKINLALHVRRRRPDGYHELETLFAFAVDGDVVTVERADEPGFSIIGPFAEGLSSNAGANLVARALDAFVGHYAIPTPHAIVLEKNLPIASGIGGGSADAAATLRALATLHGVAHSDPTLDAIATSLGADVPACLLGRTTIGTGKGDALVEIDGLPGMPLLLVNPRVPVSTAAVFAAWDGIDRGPIPDGDLLTRAQRGRNDLEPPATRRAPVIAEVRAMLDSARGVTLARMSGSGATCFALFDTLGDRDAAEAESIARGWWTLASVLA